MKKHIYKLVAGVLIGTMMFSMTACSSGSSNKEGNIEQNIPMGRYVENYMEIPNEMKSIIDFKMSKDGSVELYGYDEARDVIAYTSQDGKNWSAKEVKWLTDLLAGQNRVNQMAYGQDDTMYVLYSDKEYATHIGRVVDGMGIEEIPYTLEGNNYISCMEVAANGDILLGMQYNGVMRIDGKSGSLIKEYMSTGTDGTFAMGEDELMLLDVQKGGITIFDLETGNEKGFVSYEGNLWGSKLLVGAEGITYIVNSDGISRLAKGGNVWEQVIEGQMSSFGMPSLYMRAVTMEDEEQFTVLFSNQAEGYELINYTFDPNTPAKPTTEVSLYMLEDNQTIRQAVAEYQRQNPEVLINMQLGIEEGDTATKADAIRILNTQLLAGKGPDILLLDGLPIQSYVDKGVLLDMSDWADPLLKGGTWLENIVGAYQEKDGGIYALPTRFTLPTMWGNQDIINNVGSVEELAAWAQANPDKQVVYSMTPQQLIEKFYSITAHTWLDEEGQIDEATFATFLEAIKILADNEAQGNKDSHTSNALSTEYMAHKDIEIHVQDISGFMTIPQFYSAIVQRGDGDFGLALDKEGGIFKGRGILGINAKSQYQDIAQGIVEMAMSEEVQRVELGDGLSIHKDVLEKQSQLDERGLSMMAMTMAIEKPIQMIPANQESFTKLRDLIANVSIPGATDEVLLNLILEETKGYFDGEKTVQEAAASTAKRTRAYLAE